MRRSAFIVISSATLVLSACHHKPNDDADASASPSPAPTAASDSAPSPSPMATSAPAPVGSYDTSKATVSTVKLGAFPYLALPAGYVAESPQTLDLARFPFWVGDHFVWIEGKVYQSHIDTASGKTFSKYELQKNIEAEIAQAGGTKIVEAQLPSDMRAKLDPDATQVDTGLGDIIGDPVEVFLIHRADKDLWINFVSGTSGASWAIVETKPFVPTVKLPG